MLGSILVDSTHSQVPAQKGQYSCRRSKSESTPSYPGYRGGYRKGGGFAVDEKFRTATGGGSSDVEESIAGRSQAQGQCCTSFVKANHVVDSI